MATKLEKPVTREVADWSGPGKEGRRPLLVTLHPAGFITFRPKGLRSSYDVDFLSAYMMAVRRYADRERRERSRKKELRKGGMS